MALIASGSTGHAFTTAAGSRSVGGATMQSRVAFWIAVEGTEMGPSSPVRLPIAILSAVGSRSQPGSQRSGWDRWAGSSERRQTAAMRSVSNRPYRALIGRIMNSCAQSI